MRLESVIYGQPVTASELETFRFTLASRIKELLSRSGAGSLLCFSLNIAGKVKNFPLAEMAFQEGLSEIHSRLNTFLPSSGLLHFEESHSAAGPCAIFLLASAPEPIKQNMTAIEESHPLGRLFNMNVFRKGGEVLSRSSLGLLPRSCLVCGEPALQCAKSRTHSPELIQWRTAQILNEYFRGHAADMAASCAVRALLYEVSATPKPGLVDRNNSGSHQDMDFFTFLDSSAALIPWFRDFFCLGWDHAGEPEKQLFSRLRFAGQKAEAGMFYATGNVNTHKGLIFSSAILCAALGKLHAAQKAPLDSSKVLSVCRQLGSCSLQDFSQAPQNSSQTSQKPSQAASSVTGQTAGEKCHAAYGLLGARGEAAAGFPSALEVGLPAIKKWLSQGYSLNDAAVLALLTMLTTVDDTNMIHRGGLDLALESKKEAASLLSSIDKENFKEKLTALDLAYIRRNLSPGGCADLLAISLMFHFLETCGMVSPFSSGTFEPPL